MKIADSNRKLSTLSENIKVGNSIVNDKQIDSQAFDWEKSFQEILMDAGIVTTIRKTRGDDIDAACGQLAGQVQDKTKRTQRLQFI